ncbi:MAG TPA: ATP-binding protein [Alphaproteobacteria bacterium]|nr:ATP-binding protein [Alphaproteobacteria bacterium]
MRQIDRNPPHPDAYEVGKPLLFTHAVRMAHALAGVLVIGIGWLAFTAPPSMAAEVARILLVGSAHNIPAEDIVHHRITAAFQTDPGANSGRAEIFTEFLDFIRFPGSDHKARALTYLRDKYAEIPINLVFALGPPALEFLLEHRTTIAGEAPLVFTLVGEETLRARELLFGITGVVSRFDAQATVDLALTLQPRASQLVVITGSAAFDKNWETVARRQLGRFETRLTIRYLSGLPIPELLAELKNLGPETIVLYLSYFADRDGRQYTPRDIAHSIAATANAPVYSVYSSFLGQGIVGGVMETFEEMGAAAARIGLRILAGEKPEQIGLTETDANAVLDWRQLQRWNLNESRLPSSAEIRFKDASLWDRYKVQVVLACGLILLQSALIGALLVQARRRRFAEQDADQQRQNLMHLTRVSTLGELSGAIAHELNQPLAAILSNAQAAQLMLERTPIDLGEIRSILEDIVHDDNRAGNVIRQLRGLIKKRATKFETFDLNIAVNDVLNLAHSDLVERSVVVTTELAKDLPVVHGDKVQLKQVLLNLVINASDAMTAVKPSARSLIVSTGRAENDAVRVSICDRGVGIPSSLMSRVFEPFFTTKEHGLGLGLSICRTIVSAHNGRLEASNNAEGGATFNVMLPALKGGRA